MSSRGVPIMIDGVHCMLVEAGLQRLAGDLVGDPVSRCFGSGKTAALVIRSSMRRANRAEREWMRETLRYACSWWRKQKGLA